MAKAKADSKIQKLIVTVQLTGNNQFANFFDIAATADGGKRFGASGSLDDPFDVLIEVLEQIRASYPNRQYFPLCTMGQHTIVTCP
jgi:hypothetical protein